MPSNKKRLESLVDAVALVLGDQGKAKKLRKRKAMKRFIEKMEVRHRELEVEAASARPKGRKAKELERQVELLEKQIRRAKRLREDL